MRTLCKLLSLLLLLTSFVLVYALRSYTLCSLLYLFAWFCLLLAGSFCPSRRILRFGALCWLLIFIGFGLALLFPLADPPLPAGLKALWSFYCTLFLLPLSGLPLLHMVCIPLSLLMLALHGLAFHRLRRLEAFYTI